MLKVSVILPTYNESIWLNETISLLDDALNNADILDKEILVVDDGSTDTTRHVVKSLKTKTPLKYLYQQNAGRFLARKKGISAAKYDYVLFIDSRVHIHQNSLKYVANKISKNSKKRIWNAHVDVAKEGNFYARFWDAITFIAWRKYFVNPRETSYGLKDFDYYPKGTTCFLAPKSLVQEAMKQFAVSTKDVRTSNDDTLLIRSLAEKENINISPGFSCTYHSRSTLKKFLKHAHHRGRVFVDGFLRRDNNRYFLPLVLFLIATSLAPIFIILWWEYVKWVVLIGLIAWIAELLIALYLRVPARDAASLFVLSPLFGLFYGLGIWRAFIKRVVGINDIS